MDPRLLIVLPALAFSFDASAQGRTKKNHVETGIASVYADKFHGRKTASGDIFRQELPTAAHKTLPLGTRVTVTNLQNGRSAELLINDRGPFIDGRIIDLSTAAAELIEVDGLARVRVEAAQPIRQAQIE